MDSAGIESHGESVGSSSVSVVLTGSVLSWLWIVVGLVSPRSGSGPSLLARCGLGDVVVDLDEDSFGARLRGSGESILRSTST